MKVGTALIIIHQFQIENEIAAWYHMQYGSDKEVIMGLRKIENSIVH